MGDRFNVRSVEYPIADHCNLSCAHCDHASPLLPPKLADVRQYERDLERLARVLHADEFRVIGGEPLLHPDLLELLALARTSQLSRTITLVTNGVLLHQAPLELWRMIDTLWLSLYPTVAVRMDLDELRRRCDEHGVVLDRRDVVTFKQTLINTKIDDSAVVQRIYDRCLIAHKWRCYTVHDGRLYKCSPAPFMEPRLKLRGVAFSNPDDGVRLDDADLSERLQTYLSDTRPLAACSYCLGTSGFDVPHRQLKRREVREAIARDDGPIEALIDYDDLAHTDPAAIQQPMFWWHRGDRSPAPGRRDPAQTVLS